MADQLVGELHQIGSQGHDAVACLASLMLIKVSRHLVKVRDERKVLGSASMALLHEYVTARLSEPIFVADLARHLGVSASG